METGELGKYAIIHAAGKSIIDKYNIDGSPVSMNICFIVLISIFILYFYFFPLIDVLVNA